MIAPVRQSELNHGKSRLSPLHDSRQCSAERKVYGKVCTDELANARRAGTTVRNGTVCCFLIEVSASLWRRYHVVREEGKGREQDNTKWKKGKVMVTWGIGMCMCVLVMCAPSHIHTPSPTHANTLSHM
jgi:hypothetical protein